MTPQTAIMLLALLGAVVCLQGVVLADEARSNVGGINAVDSSSSQVTHETTLDEVRNSEGYPGSEVHEIYSSSVEDDTLDSSTEVADDEGGAEDDLSPAHPLARILTERSGKRCWSVKHCKKHFKKPGCCKKKCVNLMSDNSNCGKCGKCCNTKKGYCCRSGKCRKPEKKADDKKPHQDSMQCGYHKKCNRKYTCCKGNCVNLKSNSGHCGKCGNGCGYRNSCCNGKCVNLMHESRNCGQCGRSCGYGRKCCNGSCKNIFGNDKHNCGVCGKKCDTKCQYGMCGYGH